MANDPTATVKVISSHQLLAVYAVRFVLQLGTKFGVESGHAPHLLSVAKSFGLDVVGVR